MRRCLPLPMPIEKSRKTILGKIYWECDAHVCKVCKNFSSLQGRWCGGDISGSGWSCKGMKWNGTIIAFSVRI